MTRSNDGVFFDENYASRPGRRYHEKQAEPCTPPLTAPAAASQPPAREINE